MNNFLAGSIALALAAAAPQPAQLGPASPPASEASVPLTAAEAGDVVGKLASALEENFVIPEVGKAYAAAVRAKFAAGGYSGLQNADEFAKAVTADLQAVYPDRHLRLTAPKQGADGERKMRGLIGTDSTIDKSGWLADGVAYVSFTMFSGNEATLAALRSFLDRHAGAKTLIIDARGHRGGGIAEMDMLFPALYEKEQLLLDMDTRVAVEQRDGSPFEDGATIRRVEGPEGVVRRAHWVVPAAGAAGLQKAQVFLLTSKRTASAAEHLALALKRTHRATLIGETTGGAGNYGRLMPLVGGYAAFIPVGRTFDPDTGKGWEGTGVKPDIEVPADRALDEALRRAGVTADAAKALAALN